VVRGDGCECLPHGEVIESGVDGGTLQYSQGNMEQGNMEQGNMGVGRAS
jgi:hypothetical protein